MAYNANPSTGFSVYDSVAYQAKGWMSLGGTSAGAPQWAALIAIADEGRQLAGKHSLDGRTQTLPALYNMPASNFHDITTGNNGYLAVRRLRPRHRPRHAVRRPGHRRPGAGLTRSPGRVAAGYRSITVSARASSNVVPASALARRRVPSSDSRSATPGWGRGGRRGCA